MILILNCGMLVRMECQVLTREMPFTRAEGDNDGRKLVGQAVPFNEITRIDSWWEGLFDEQFAKGAFKRTLKERTPKVMFEHGTHPLFGSLPIAELEEATEKDRGLWIEAGMFEADLFAPLREGIASDAIDAMSIRFRPTKIEITDADSRTDGGDIELRTVTEAELFELGPVMFPAYEATSIDLRSLGTLDLSNQNDRHRLAIALLGGASQTGQGPVIPHGLGVDLGTGSTAALPDPTSRHSDPAMSPRRRRACVARLQPYLS